MFERLSFCFVGGASYLFFCKYLKKENRQKNKVLAVGRTKSVTKINCEGLRVEQLANLCGQWHLQAVGSAMVILYCFRFYSRFSSLVFPDPG